MSPNINGASSFVVSLATLAVTTVALSKAITWLKLDRPELSNWQVAGRVALLFGIGVGVTLGAGAVGVAGAIAIEAGAPIIAPIIGFTAKVMAGAGAILLLGAGIGKIL